MRPKRYPYQKRPADKLVIPEFKKRITLEELLESIIDNYRKIHFSI